MQWLVELIAGLIALLAASAFNQIGVDFRTPSAGDREVRRIEADCRAVEPAPMIAAQHRDC